MLYRVALGIGMIVGVGLSGVGIAAAISSHTIGWVVVAFGLCAAVTCGSVLLNVWPYRGVAGDALSEDGGLILPLRPGYATRSTVAPLLLGVVILIGAVAYGSVFGIAVGLGAFALCCLYGWWLHRSRFRHLTVRIDPQGIGTADGRTRVAWRDIKLVDIVEGAFPGVAVAGPNTAPVALHMQATSWRPAQLQALVERATRSSAFRARLDDPQAVRMFITVETDARGR